MKIAEGLQDEFRENWGIPEEDIQRLLKMQPNPAWDVDKDHRRYMKTTPPEDANAGYDLLKKLWEALGLDQEELTYQHFTEWKYDGQKLGTYLNRQVLMKAREAWYIDDELNFRSKLGPEYLAKPLATISKHHETLSSDTSPFKLMLTCNPEDKLMASMHAQVNSCISLNSSYGMWRTLPGLIWNPEVAMLALVDTSMVSTFKMANGYTVSVPKVHARAWVYLMYTEEDTEFKNPIGNISKTYGASFLNCNELTKTYSDFKWVSKFDYVGQSDFPKSSSLRSKPARLPFYKEKDQFRLMTPYFDTACKVEFRSPLRTYQIITGRPHLVYTFGMFSTGLIPVTGEKGSYDDYTTK